MLLCWRMENRRTNNTHQFESLLVEKKRRKRWNLRIYSCLQLMGEEPDLDPDITKEFFENNILQFDPSLLTENGMKWEKNLEDIFGIIMFFMGILGPPPPNQHFPVFQLLRKILQGCEFQRRQIDRQASWGLHDGRHGVNWNWLPLEGCLVQSGWSGREGDHLAQGHLYQSWTKATVKSGGRSESKETCTRDLCPEELWTCFVFWMCSPFHPLLFSTCVGGYSWRHSGDVHGQAESVVRYDFHSGEGQR